MKKYIVYSASIALLMGATAASAQVATSTGGSETVKQTQQQQKRSELEKRASEKKTGLEQKAAERKAEMEKKKAEFQQRMTEKRKALVLSYGEKMTKRLNAALDRELKIADRIQAYAEKDENKDRVKKSEILLKLTGIRTEITNVRTLITATQNDLSGIFDADDPKGSMEKVRTEIKDIHDKIKAIHQSLVKLVADLRVKADKADKIKTEKGRGENATGSATSTTR